MKAGIFPSLTHHLLKVSVPLGIVSSIVYDIRGRVPFLGLASTVGQVIALLMTWMAFEHARTASRLETCAVKSASVLNRPAWRIWRGYARWGSAPALLVVLAIMMTGPLVLSEPAHPEDTFDWGASLGLVSMFLVLSLQIATLHFRNVHFPEDPVWKPMRSFMDGPGQKLRHNGHWAVLTMIAVGIALDFLPGDRARVTANVFCFPLFLIALYADHRHSKTLCEQCVTEFRTDAPEHAERHRKRFTAIHRYGWIPMILLLVSIGVDSFFGDPFGPYPFAASMLTCAVFSLLEYFHRSYRPWCPYCRGDDGGDDGEVEGAPEPSGGYKRPLPVT